MWGLLLVETIIDTNWLMLSNCDTYAFSRKSSGIKHFEILSGEVAQWLRRLTADRKVSSSIPAKGERYLKPMQPYGSLSRM